MAAQRALVALALAQLAPGARALPDMLLNNLAFAEVAERSVHVGPRLQELRARGPSNSSVEPQQLHLSLTGDETEMRVMWVTYGVANGSVSWAPASGSSSAGTSSAAAVRTTYTAGVGGWSGYIYTAVMSGLVPGATYSYQVGSGGPEGAWSLSRTFDAAPAPGPAHTSYLCVFGDMGTIMPLGWAVSDAITENHLLGRRFDLILVAGDLSYATVTPPNGEVEWSWDTWMMQVEPYASTAPFMTVVGNHEASPGTVTNASGSFDVGFAAFSARFNMVDSVQRQNLWFSFDFKNIHFVCVSSEHPYSATDPQHVWAAADLAKVDRAVTPWVIFSQHRHVVSSDESEFAPPSTSDFFAAWSPLLEQYSVDLVVNGHQHMYERSQALRGQTIASKCDENGVYTNPGAPIYLVIGTAGAEQVETLVEPQPEWSAHRRNDTFAYGRMTVAGAANLTLELVDIYGEVQDVMTILKS